MPRLSHQYDVFIAHASEDKATLVRHLARALRSRRFAVWYDEFSLRLGDGLRQSIDQGLKQSRFGVVVLSKAFFSKRWPQWELDGLVQRQLSDKKVILPIWHELSREEVAAYSPSLANIYAAVTCHGLDAVVEQIAAVLRPERSSLEVAYDVLSTFGADPPAISDDWWLSVAEEHGYPYTLRDPWRLRVPACASGIPQRGWDLAWAAMQLEWRQEASYRRLACTAHPSEVLRFIQELPGLDAAATADVEGLLLHAPQLGVPDCAGPFEQAIEHLAAESVAEHEERRRKGDQGSSGCTTNGLSPLCEKNVALRHCTFGDWKPDFYVSEFCKTCDGDFFGIDVADAVFWLLSARSEWIPTRHRDYLLDGIRTCATWGWGRSMPSDGSNPEEVRLAQHYGRLGEYLHKMLRTEPRKVRLPTAAMDDLHERVGYSARILDLPESVAELADRFLRLGFLNEWLREHRWRMELGKTRRRKQSATSTYR